MIELANEDNFRLNVLLANKPQAIRIDASRMVVYGLSAQGEAKVPLNPNTRPEPYLRAVKELISGHILGSPGGYPIYLQRWTRMGQMRDQSLEQLLMLGEPEAVVAAVCSPGLTNELARRAWWAMEDAENARRMLCNPTIVQGSMGSILADYLVEFLPFETETEKMTESVRLVLQPGLIGEKPVAELWRRSGRRQAYLVGFLQARPDDLPEQVPERADLHRVRAHLDALIDRRNPCAILLERVLSGAGQTNLKIVAKVLAKPPTQDVVQATFETLRGYFGALRPGGDPDLPIDDLMADALAYADPERAPATVQACLRAAPESGRDLTAARVLSGLGYGALRPVLRDTTAIGSLMRKKLKPVLDPVLAYINILLGGGG